LALCPLLFFGNFFYNYSLLFTSISSSIVVTNLNGAFTLLLSALSGVEEVTRTKVGGVILCLVGVLLVAQGDRAAEKASGDKGELYGDACALLGACCYGAYTTLLKIKIPDESFKISTAALFGYMGLFSLILGAPVVAWMAATGRGGTDKLTWSTLSFILVEELFDSVLANYLYARAAILATPSVAAVGESLTIPLSISAQAVFAAVGSPLAGDDGGGVSVWDVCGGLMVTAGFVLLVR